MGYLTVKEFSKLWGITERRIIKLCTENRISGAVKNGMVWLIPEESNKPADRRTSISKYINPQKRIIIFGMKEEISEYLFPLLKKEGFTIEVISQTEKYSQNENIKFRNEINLQTLLKNSEKYYEGLIFLDFNNNQFEKETIIKEFSKKMNCESSIVLVEKYKKNQIKLEEKLAKKLKKEIGLKINCLELNVPNKNVIINYNEIAEDILILLTKLKNTTGERIKTDGGYIQFNENGRTHPMEIGIFYKAIENYFKKLTKKTTMWSASTMLQDEWTEEPAEMKFRITNLEAANRGANLERIFIFSKTKIKEFKKNKTLKLYMQNNINTMFVDYDEILEKEPKLLSIVKNGWDGINKETLIVDLPEGTKERGYISINKKEIEKAYECFQHLKYYAKDLKQILK